jgi:beta-lactamase class D
MKFAPALLGLLFALFSPAAAHAAPAAAPAADPTKVALRDFGRYFSGSDGCFVLYDAKTGGYTIYNEAEARTPISPCSTFKIVHSLIGLEAGIVKDETAVFPWDGTRYPIAEWNRDLSMAEAIRLSAYWYYQRIARSIGPSRMRGYLENLGFGNADVSGGIDLFWQRSSLLISPKAWVDELRRIRSYDIPFPRRDVDILRRIIRQGEKGGAVLYGKTGSGMAEPGFASLGSGAIVSGWFVGFVEKGPEAWCFATHVGAPSGATGAAAKEITLRILGELGIY